MRSAVTAVIVMTAMLVAGVGSPASAASQCDAADFTVGGEFDLDGYLACVGGTGGGGVGGGLPATGSNTVQIIAIAIGLLAIGGAFIFTAYRGRVDAA